MTQLKENRFTGPIHDLLYRLGIVPNSISFLHTAAAIQLALQNPDTLLLVTKLLYPIVAQQFHTNWQTIERSLRRSITIAWNTDPQLLSELARHPLTEKPTPGQFLSIAANYLSRDPGITDAPAQ